MRQLGQCLNEKLADIIQAAMMIQGLNIALQEYLPADLRPHFSVGSFNHGCLVLVTTDSVWASQLRYHLPELRDTLRKKAQLYQLASIKLSISTDDATPFKPQKRYPSLSNKACATILSASEQCDYTPLKHALKQLARPNMIET